MHVLGVTFVLEGELSYLSIFVVEGTRSIAIKLFSLHRVRCTTSEHHFLFVLSRLPSLCCVLCSVGLFVFRCVVCFRTPDNRNSMYLAANTAEFGTSL